MKVLNTSNINDLRDFNMAGIKGRSGRKSWDKEIDSRDLWDLSIPVLKYALKSEIVSAAKRIDIALALFQKMAPSEVKGDDGNKVSVFNFGEIDPAARRGLIEVLRARRSEVKST